MYTHTRTMSSQERETLPINTLPDFDLQPGKPTGQRISIKLPALTWIINTSLIHDVLLLRVEEHLQLKGHTCGTLRYFWKDALQRMSIVWTETIIIMMLLG